MPLSPKMPHPDDSAPESDSGSPLDRPKARPSRKLAVLAAVGAHGALLIGAGPFIQTPGETKPAPPAQVTQLVAVRLAPPPAPQPDPEPAPEPAPEAPAPPPVKRPPRKAPARRTLAPTPAASPEPAEPAEAAAAPAAAAALAALTAKPTDSAEAKVPKLVSGTASESPGGASSAQGKGQTHVGAKHARADGRGAEDAPPGAVDLSRPPGLAGGARWDCPFPREADYEGINQASVILKVKVGAQGQVQTVQVHNDPGFGFGREARRCALRKRWQPGLNPTGQPIARAVALRVHFKR